MGRESQRQRGRERQTQRGADRGREENTLGREVRKRKNIYCTKNFKTK